MKNLIIIILLGASFNASAQGVAKLDLKAAYERSLQYSLERQSSADQIEIHQEQLGQARGSVLPTVSLRMRHFRQDSLQGQSFADNQQTSSFINLTQPLLQGLREYTALGIAKRNVTQAQLAHEVQERQILFNIARVYYGILVDQSELKNTLELQKLMGQRVSDLKERVRIGRSRVSEQLLAESQLVTIESRQKNLERNLSLLWNEFERMTGVDHRVELVGPQSPVKLEGVSYYLTKLENLPEMQRAQLGIELADKQVQLQKRYHYPELTFDGNYYLQRDGVQKDRDWDLSLNLRVPIYEGSKVQSRVREAALMRNQKTLEMQNLKRTLESEIKELYAILELDLARLNVTRRAVELARRNYDEQKREYNLGLVTNQEVLQALNAYIENQQSYDRLQLESAYNSLILNAKIGEFK